MAEKEYKVMLLDRDVDNTKFIFENIDSQLDMYKRAYATEMSIMNEQPIPVFQFDDQQICVAFTKEFELIGFLAFGFNQISKILFIEHVYVVPNYRRKGVYSTMLKRIEKLAKDLKADKMCAFVFQKNWESMQTHQRIGFKTAVLGYFKEVEYDN